MVPHPNCEHEGLLQAIPAHADWGSTFCVATPMVRLANAQVLWINDRWMLGRGVDTTRSDVRARVSAWLLKEFALLTSLPGRGHAADPVVVDGGADRYGATGRVGHGGSGRAVICGHFQVKGTGPTSLVGRDADWFHSHGCLWMEEAIREVMFGELFELEMGGGTVPTIAIIDTGLNLRHADGNFGERRALSVRPFAPRIAHLQRAYGFQPPSCDPPTALNRVQREDTWRVRCAWRAYDRAVDAGELLSLPGLFERVGERVAFSHVWKLSHGGFYASNITLDGRLIDFGSATAVSDWTPQPVSTGGAWFGAERESMAGVARSLSFHAGRFAAARRRPSVDQLMRSFDDGYANGRRRQIAIHCGPARSAKAAAALDRAIRLGPCSGPVGSVDPLVLRRAKPRSTMGRQCVQEKIFTELVTSRGSRPPTAHDVATFVGNALSEALRVFPGWRLDGEILAQRTDGTTMALVEASGEGEARLRVAGPVSANHVLIFGEWLAIDHLVAGCASGDRWQADIPVPLRSTGSLPMSQVNVRNALILPQEA